MTNKLAASAAASGNQGPNNFDPRPFAEIESFDVDALIRQFDPSTRLRVNLARHPFNFNSIPAVSGVGMPMFDMPALRHGTTNNDHSDRSSFTQNISLSEDKTMSHAQQFQQMEYLAKRLKGFGL